jgi:SAM-dependent methyltransferase
MPHQWNEIARLRAEQIDGGLDLTFSKVFVPYYSGILAERKPTDVLEIGGGTGHLARELRRFGSTYVMIEPSAGMYAIAQQTLQGCAVEIINQTIEAFSSGGRRFGFVFSHMCIQTVENLDVFVGAVSTALAPDSRYMVSLPHPAFYNDYKQFFPKETFRYMEERATLIDFTITLDPGRKIKGVPYQHRPLSVYVAAFAKASLNVSVLDEIYPSPDIQALYGGPWKFPRYLVLGGEREHAMRHT